MSFFDTNEVDAKVSEMSDEALLSASIAHPHYFGVIIDRYEDALLRKTMTILRSKEEAEDIVQETFAKIYLHAHAFKKQEGASFKSWAYKILINTAFTKYQKLKKERKARIYIDIEQFESIADTKSRQFEKQELSEYVISVLSKMPEHLRRVLTLHVLEGRPQEEVARIEQVSVGAVKTRVHRAKKMFKEIDIALI